eukprot:6803630-Alexandrium_andersonii.AAC.1
MLGGHCVTNKVLGRFPAWRKTQDLHRGCLTWCAIATTPTLLIFDVTKMIEGHCRHRLLGCLCTWPKPRTPSDVAGRGATQESPDPNKLSA